MVGSSQSQPSNLYMEHMSWLLGTKALGDIELVAEDGSVYAHSAVLIARSDFMRGLLGGGWASTVSAGGRIPVEDISVAALSAFVHYLYMDRLPTDLHVDSLPELLYTASLHLMKRMCQLVQLRMVSEFDFDDLDSVVPMLGFTLSCGGMAASLRSMCLFSLVRWRGGCRVLRFIASRCFIDARFWWPGVML